MKISGNGTSMRTLVLNKLFFYFLCVSILVSVNVSADSDDTFTNLKVLDSVITKDELISKMKMMSRSLGVRCDFCHAENAQGEHDFASDEKEHKKIARSMMIMTKDINASMLSQLSAIGETDVQAVTCFTCHHNDKKPRVLQETILKTIEQNGLDSAFTKYQVLKDEFYGSSVYDFSESSLNNVAMELAENEKVDDAIKVLQFNESQFPESMEVKEMFVIIYMRTDQKEKAIEMCNKILEIDPENRRVKRTLEHLTEKK